jgi:hypothetical protein
MSVLVAIDSLDRPSGWERITPAPVASEIGRPLRAGVAGIRQKMSTGATLATPTQNLPIFVISAVDIYLPKVIFSHAGAVVPL